MADADHSPEGGVNWRIESSSPRYFGRTRRKLAAKRLRQTGQVLPDAFESISNVF